MSTENFEQNEKSEFMITETNKMDQKPSQIPKASAKSPNSSLKSASRSPRSPRSPTLSNDLKSKIPIREQRKQPSKLDLIPPENKRFKLNKKCKSVVGNCTSPPNSLSTVNKPPMSANSLPGRVNQMHQMGKVPEYLKKKRGKEIIENEYTMKKAQYAKAKQQMEKDQQEVIKAYEAFKEIREKRNFPNEAKIEELKLVTVVDNAKGEILIKEGKSCCKGYFHKFSFVETSLAPILDNEKIEKIKNDLLEINNSSRKLFNQFYEDFMQMQNQNDSEKSDEFRDFGLNLLNMLKTIKENYENEAQNAEQFTLRIIEDIKNTIYQTNETLRTDLESHKIEKSNLEQKLNDLQEKVKSIKSSYEEKQLSLKKSTKKNIEEINELKTNLKSLKEENINLNKEYQNTATKWEKEMQSKNEIRKKNQELQNKHKTECENLTKEIVNNKEKHKSIEEQLQKKLEHESRLRIKTEEEISNIKAQLSYELNNKHKSLPNEYVPSAGDQKIQENKKLLAQIEQIQVLKTNADKEIITLRAALESKRAENEKNNNEFQESIKNLNDRITKLQVDLTSKDRNIEYLKRKNENMTNSNAVMEKEKSAKSHENCCKAVLELESKLMETNKNLKAMEAKIEIKDHLLVIRSELINTMEDNEKEYKKNIDLLKRKLSIREDSADEIYNEFSAKSEDIQNLFSTLGTKQIEVNKLKNLIKVLKDNQKINSNIMKEMHEKLAILQSENMDLKDMLSKYYKLSKNTSSNNNDLVKDSCSK